MTKTEARKIFLEKRMALKEAELQFLNDRLYNRFFSAIDLSSLRNLHIFLSLEQKKEPDTWQILDRISRDLPNVRLIIPKVNTESSSLEHFYFEGLHQLKTNSWGIKEPFGGIPADISEIDMVIVPLVAVDFLGNRVGYGKGFYDKFLIKCREGCKRTGLSFFEPIQEPIETNKLDVPLMSCVTATQLVIF